MLPWRRTSTASRPRTRAERTRPSTSSASSTHAAGYAFANLDRRPERFPDDVDRQNLSLFFALQFTRGPDMREFRERIDTEVSRMAVRVGASSPEYVRNFLTSSGQDASDDAVARTSADLIEASKNLTVTPHNNTHAAAIFQGAVEFVPFFYKRHWVIARSPAPLLTSDRPVVLYAGRDALAPGGGIGLMNAEIIVFVLDRCRVLLMQHPEPPNRDCAFVDLGAEWAPRLNSAVANRAHRWLFHHPADSPLEGIPFNPNPT
jgi:hypothetical protein